MAIKSKDEPIELDYAPWEQPVSDISSDEPIELDYAPWEQPGQKIVYSWKEAVKKAPGSFIPGITQSLENLGQTLIHPVQTLKGVSNVLGGVARDASNQAGRLFGVKPRPYTTLEQEAGAKGLYEYLSRFNPGSDEMRRQIAENSGGMFIDLASLVYGGAGAAGKLAKLGNLSKTAEVANLVSKGADIVNPITWAGKGVGAATSGVVKGGSKLSNLFRSPGEKALESSLEGQGAVIAEGLRNAPKENIRGFPLSSHEVVADLPDSPTKFQALGREIKEAQDPTKRFKSKIERTQSHVDTLSSFAGTPELVKEAQQARKIKASELYDKPNSKMVKMGPQLENLLNRPALREAYEKAAKNAANLGEDFGVLNPQGKERLSRISGKDLHGIKMGLDDIIQSAAPGSKELASLQKLKSEYVNLLEYELPGYKKARQSFQKLSAPINQMEVGQHLLNKLNTELGALSGTEKASRFVEYVKNAHKEIPSLLSKTTGAPRNTSIRQILTPKQMEVVDNVVKDLKTEAKSKAMSKEVLDSLVEEGKLPEIPALLNTHIFLANKGVKWLNELKNNQIVKELGEVFDNPEVAINKIEALEKKKKISIEKAQRLKSNIQNLQQTVKNPAIIESSQYLSEERKRVKGSKNVE